VLNPHFNKGCNFGILKDITTKRALEGRVILKWVGRRCGVGAERRKHRVSIIKTRLLILLTEIAADKEDRRERVGGRHVAAAAVTWSTSSCGLPVRHWIGSVDKSERKWPDKIRVQRGHWHWRSHDSNVCSLLRQRTAVRAVPACVAGCK